MSDLTPPTEPTGAAAEAAVEPPTAPHADPARPPEADRATGDDAGMTLARATWLLTAAVFLGFGTVLLAESYIGYAIVTLVTGIAAAINLL